MSGESNADSDARRPEPPWRERMSWPRVALARRILQPTCD